MIRKNLLIILLAAFCMQSSIAQNKAQFAYSMQTSQTGTFSNNYGYTYLLRPLKKDNTTGTTYECRLIGVKIKDNNSGSNYLLNTDSLRKTTFNNSSVIEKLALLNKPFTVVVDNKGKVTTVTGVDNLIAEAVAKWQIQPEIANQFKGNIPAIQADLQRMFLPLPDKKIGFGSEWTSNATRYKVIAIKGAVLEIAVKNATEDANNTQTGKYVYNDVTGLIEKAEGSGKSKDEKAKPAYIMNHSFTQQIRYGANIPPLDTGWINMAVKMSYWSTALKKATGYDSAKVAVFFKANDARYNSDRYYRLGKLSILQGFKNYDTYKFLLSKTPNYMLAGESSHLFNKMNDAISTSPDSAFDAITYFYKTSSFNGWLHQSFAQNFNDRDVPLEKNEDWKKAMREHHLSEKQIDSIVVSYYQQQKNGVKLLQKLTVAKQPEMRQNALALKLWVDAKAHPDNSKLLLQTGEAFKKMNDKEMQLGDGGRYAMLIYNMIYNAGDKSAAASLLDKTIIKLEKYTADTLNNNRYADQNLLAHAYYLKYVAAKPADSVKALQYLAKAAQYSPKNNSEKAYASFYDRVFLNSKESYREEFIDKLFKSGDEQQALAIFAEHINAQPEKLDEMEKVYTAHFPNKSFKAFFADNIMAAWQQAPEFTLKDIEGKEHQLSTYRNKWLVLDFWGTWCGPCREEMPRLNKFNEELVKGEHAGINFLSIACYDTNEKVKAFFTENKYNIPVVMSDNVVQKTYKISGYPSKILISPEGKMLSIKFGEDWLAILKKFSQLYASN